MKNSVPLILALVLLQFSCNSKISNQYNYLQPEYLEDGFNVAALDQVNIDSDLIIKAVDDIQRGEFEEVHSVLIFKDDKLVFEKYFTGHKYQWDGDFHHGDLVTWDQNMLHGVKSVSKSITSTCIGLAIDHGFINSVHQSIFDYLPDHQHLNTGGRDKITIEHLLTMTSGLEWDEWGVPLSSKKNDIVGLWFDCADPIACILERPLIAEPGTSFTYSGGGMIVLGEIIKNATKMNIAEFSKKYLFEPLSIDSAYWDVQFENGVFEAAGSLELTPRDMVKIGVTFLNKGVWNGKRIISEQWVEKSAVSFNGNNNIKIPGEFSGRSGYSYSWWIKPFFASGKIVKMFYAGGWGGQDIMVFSELNAVVVFTGGNYLTKPPPFKIIKKYVIPAME